MSVYLYHGRPPALIHLLVFPRLSFLKGKGKKEERKLEAEIKETKTKPNENCQNATLTVNTIIDKLTIPGLTYTIHSYKVMNYSTLMQPDNLFIKFKGMILLKKKLN